MAKQFNFTSKSNQQFKMGQKYLGLRPHLINIPNNPLTGDILRDLDEAQKSEIQTRYDRITRYRRIDLDTVVSYPFHERVQFIALDIEWWDKDSRVLTEIGVSILDTDDITSLPPKEGAAGWFAAVKHRHLRVSEYEHIRNSTYVSGDPTAFQYGKSESIKSEDIFQSLEEVFSLVEQNKENTDSARKIVLVGHGIQGDIDVLKKRGIDLTNSPHIIDTLDTQDLWYAINGGYVNRQAGLENILLNLDISYSKSDLHNAGNDAALTMSAFLNILLLESTNPGRSVGFPIYENAQEGRAIEQDELQAEVNALNEELAGLDRKESSGDH